MKIAIGCDHIVTDIKISASGFLKSQGHEVIDVGTYDFSRTHYPIYGKRVGELVSCGTADQGVVICGTGVGITNAANKVPGVRAALVRDLTTALYAKKHLNANVIGFGGKIIGELLLHDILRAFLTQPYEPAPQDEVLLSKLTQLDNGFPVKRTGDIFEDLLKHWDTATGQYTR